MKPDPNHNLRNFLTSNLTPAALVREVEEKIAAERLPLVDLRILPHAQWPEYYGRDVTLPPEIERYLAGREPGPMTPEEVQGLEIAVERHHGITAPDYVTCSLRMQREGRPWSHVSDAAPYLSGFEFNNSGA